jgi:hypothetical protein
MRALRWCATYMVATVMISPSPASAATDKAALLAAFPKGLATETSRAAWATLRGWDNQSDPCGAAGSPAWAGVKCTQAGRVSAVDFRGVVNRSYLEYTLGGSGLLRLTELKEVRMMITPRI